jgi:hypothetical protein
MGLSRRSRRPKPIESGHPRLRPARDVRTHPCAQSDISLSLMDIELPRPSATGRDLLVEVRAISVNPVDYKVRAQRCASCQDRKSDRL